MSSRRGGYARIRIDRAVSPACRVRAQGCLWHTTLALLTLVLVFPNAAAAAADLEVGMEDERLMLTDTGEAGLVVRDWRRLGVDVVRLHASWRRIAPAGRRAPRGFDARNPADPYYSWYALDNAIRLISAAGMKVFLTITGPGPHWANQERGRRVRRWARNAWRPDPRAFADFATAVARRYGRHVDRYSIWNEPNLYLAPLFSCNRRQRPRRCRPEAPHAYRRLVLSGGRAIRRADAGAEIAIGELASIGGPGRIAPIPFLREMACVTASYRPRRDGPCRHFRAPRADALAYHPHSRKWPPERRTRNPDNARFGDLPRLIAAVDELTRRGRIRAVRGRLIIRLTEFGYQTSPPDRVRGVTLRDQARYLQKALYLAWRHPRIKSLIQYQWRDEEVRNAGPGFARYAGWQSGLQFVDGRPKPALRAFARPFVAVRVGSSVMFWGLARGSPSRSIELQQWRRRRWIRVIVVRTTARGVWRRWIASPAPGRYRFVPRRTPGHVQPRASHVLRLGRNLTRRTVVIPAR